MLDPEGEFGVFAGEVRRNCGECSEFLALRLDPCRKAFHEVAVRRPVPVDDVGARSYLDELLVGDAVAIVDNGELFNRLCRLVLGDIDNEGAWHPLDFVPESQDFNGVGGFRIGRVENLDFVVEVERISPVAGLENSGAAACGRAVGFSWFHKASFRIRDLTVFLLSSGVPSPRIRS